jgi:hypothetical protein
MVIVNEFRMLLDFAIVFECLAHLFISRLTATEYSQLIGNLEEILAFQNTFLSAIEDCMK